VLFVTAGKGIIATEADHEVIGVGDVVHIPPEEKHWHGATPDSSFSHIALTAKGTRPRRWKSESAAQGGMVAVLTALPTRILLMIRMMNDRNLLFGSRRESLKPGSISRLICQL
jgi:hypothetical protein